MSVVLVLVGLATAAPAAAPVLFDGHPYVRLADWAPRAGASIAAPTALLRTRVTWPGHSLVLVPEHSVVILDGRAWQLPRPVRGQDDELYLPQVLLDSLNQLRPSRAPSTVRAVGISVRADTTVLRIEATAPPDYEGTFTAAPGYRLFVDAVGPPLRVAGRGIIRRASVVRGRGLTLNLVFREPAEARIQSFSGGLLCKFFPRATGGLRLVVVDPGHGGVDAGAIGPDGLREKEVNLDIARQLVKLLTEELGVRVIMTRTTDEFIALGARTELANRNRADLFVSVHCNAAPRNRKARGLETYFLSEARTTWTRAVAARENASIRFELPDTALADLNEIGLILHDLAQSEFLKESSALAYAVHAALLDRLGGSDRGVQQAGFFVLRGAFMPAILVESAFISCPAEQALLAQAAFRQRVARGICEGVKEFSRECFAKR